MSLFEKNSKSIIETSPQIFRRLNACLTLSEVLETARKESVQSVKADDGMIVLLNATTKDIYNQTQIGNSGNINTFFDMEGGLNYDLINYIFASDDILDYPDVSQNPLVSNDLRTRSKGSLLCVPIKSETRIIGIICVVSQKVAFFDAAKIMTLLALAEYLSVAIEIQILKDIGRDLSILGLDDMLGKIAECAHFLLGGESSAILLIETKVGSEISGKKFPPYQKENLIPRPNGLTKIVADTKEPLIIPDAHLDLRVKQTTKERGVKSIIGVPLKVSSKEKKETEVRIIGALFVNALHKNAFNYRDQKLLESLASQTAIAIENAQLVESEQRRARAFEDLFRRSLELTNYENVSHLLKEILDNAVNVLQVQGGCLYLLDKEGKNLTLVATNNRPDLKIGSKRSVEDDVVGRTIKEVKAIAISDYSDWPYRRHQNDPYEFTSVAAAPIGWQGKIVGVLAVHDTVLGSQFGSEEIDLLWYLGNLAAVAMENIYRIDEKKRLMENAFDAIIALDKNGVVVEFNSQAERILGYKANEILGTPIGKLYSSFSDAKMVMRQLRRSRDHRVSNFDTSLTSKYGQEIPIRLSASMLFDHEGDISGTVGFFQDRREYEASLELIKSSLNWKKTLNSLAEQAWQLTNASQSCHIALLNGRFLELAATYPLEYRAQLEQIIGRIDLENDRWIGIAGRAVINGKSEIVGQVSKDSDYILCDTDTCSELAVPIINEKGIIVGVIDVEHQDCDAFTFQDRQTLELLAKQAAAAIRNAQLFTESQADKKRFKTIAEIIRSSSYNLEIPQLLKQVCQLVEQDLRGKDAIVSIRLYNPQNNLLEFLPDWHESFHEKIDIPSEKGRTTQRLDEGICGWVASYIAPKNCGDVEKCPEFIRLMSSTKSELAVPICHWKEQTLIGVLDLQSSLKNTFDDDDQKLLEALADQLAVAIENAKLYERVERRSGMRKALYKAGRAITNSLDLKNLLDQIVQQAPKVIRNQGKGVSFASIRLIRDGQSQLIAAYPKNKLDQAKGTCPENMDYLDKTIEKIGIIGRAIRTGEPQLIPDVSLDLDYIPCIPETKAELTIPIKIENRVIGIINIEHSDKDAFNEEDKEAVIALAVQAGIAIDKANQYAHLNRWSQHQQAVHEASRIISAGIAVTRKELLDLILKEAIERIKPAKGGQPVLGVIQLYDKSTNEIIPESILPEEANRRWKTQLGERRSLNRDKNKIGIHGRAILERRPQRVSDIRSDKDYVELTNKTRSELDVPLLDGDQILGVLGLESDQIEAFDEIDEQALMLLAELAVIAIKNAEQYRKLEETKGLLAARTAVAWMATDRKAWQHKIIGHIGTIGNYVEVLYHYLEESDINKEKFRERLIDIGRVIEKALEGKIAGPLGPEKSVEPVNINDFIRQWGEQFSWDIELHGEISYKFKPDPKDNVNINVNSGWLQLVFDNLVNNAITAMDRCLTKNLTISTLFKIERIEIIIADSGKGIPPEFIPQLFQGIIQKHGANKGNGIGLLLSQMIVQYYDGDINLRSTGPSGTVVVINFPVGNSDQ